MTRCESGATSRCSRAATSRAPCRSTASRADEIAPETRLPGRPDELMLDGNSRQNLATFCQTWEEPQVHALMDLCHRQEHDRQGRVPADRRDRAALRAHARRPLERPEAANTVGASAIGSSEACMLAGMAAKWRWRAKRPGRGQADRQARTWCAARCRSCGTSSPSTGTSRCARSRWRRGRYGMDAGGHARAGRREHDLRRARPSASPTPATTSRSSRAVRGPRPAAGRHRPRHRHPRRRRQRRLPGPVLRPRRAVGLPAAAGEVDQHLGPQVRPGPARRRLGRLARRRPSCPTT